jgi:REP element-mobilizing transposase RayT
MNKGLPVRKNLRLKGYDYSQNGCYFVTICTKDRRPILGDILLEFGNMPTELNRHIPVGANCVRPLDNVVSIKLSPIGMVVENKIPVLSNTYGNIFVDKYVVMPNHVHAIISIMSDKLQELSWRTKFAPTISRIIKQFKGAITKRLGLTVWQKSFYDRVIRDEREYENVAEYIAKNPSNWTNDDYFSGG